MRHHKIVIDRKSSFEAERPDHHYIPSVLRTFVPLLVYLDH